MYLNLKSAQNDRSVPMAEASAPVGAQLLMSSFEELQSIALF